MQSKDDQPKLGPLNTGKRETPETKRYVTREDLGFPKDNDKDQPKHYGRSFTEDLIDILRGQSARNIAPITIEDADPYRNVIDMPETPDHPIGAPLIKRTILTVDDLTALARKWSARISSLNISLNQGTFVRLGSNHTLRGIEEDLPEGTVVIFQFEDRMATFILHYGLTT